MRFQLQQNKVRYIIISLVIFTALTILATSFIMQYLDPSNPSTAIMLKWRFPFIAFYLVFAYFSFYMVGTIGSWYTISHDGITTKIGLKENYIPWAAVKKIVLQKDKATHITVVIDLETAQQQSINLAQEYHMAKHEQTIDEIKRYWVNPNIVYV